ncbi:MAG: AMP-binding protein [Thermodesulfovibrionales bacterium]|jgi:phenylacetate-CoA ligase
MKRITAYIQASRIFVGGLLYLKKSYAAKKEIQFRKLKKLLQTAYDTTEFYRERFDSLGIKPRDIRTAEEFSRIPVLTRQELRENFPGRIVNRKYLGGKDCYAVSTSGSTGEPVTVYKSLVAALAPVSLASAAFSGTTGMGSPRIMTILVYAKETVENLLTGFLASVRKDLCMRVNLLDGVESSIEAINSFRPTILLTYPSVLRDIAFQLEKTGMTVFSPRYIYTTGEVLEKGMPEQMKKFFPGSLILNAYFCTEAGIIAAQCSEGRTMHLFLNNVFVETGEEGSIIVTDLNNLATPIIRYNGLHDMVRISKGRCDCGIEGETLDVIEGRRADSVITASGDIINPFRLTEIISTIEGVAKYQIIQRERGSILVKVISLPWMETRERIEEEIIAGLNGLFRGSMGIRVVFVETIERDPSSGMFRLVISETP